MARKRKRPARRRRVLPYFIAAAAVAVAVVLVYGPRPEWLSKKSEPVASSEKPVAEEPERKVEPIVEPAPESPREPTEPAPAEPEPRSKRMAPAADGPARVALVIDDLGRSLSDLERIAALGVPVSYSVLPFESRTPEVVRELARRDAEILCHLPMEPSGGANPGPGALTFGMAEGELVRSTERALAAVPGAVGVNHHMGSRLSADAEAMRAVLAVVAEKSLFYLDSRTTADSVAYRSALSLGLPAAERQVFLDGELTPDAVTEQFERLLGLAQRDGSAIAIGHPHAVTLDVLATEVPKAVERGFEFVPVSYLLDHSTGPPI